VNARSGQGDASGVTPLHLLVASWVDAVRQLPSNFASTGIPVRTSHAHAHSRQRVVYCRDNYAPLSNILQLCRAAHVMCVQQTNEQPGGGAHDWEEVNTYIVSESFAVVCFSLYVCIYVRMRVCVSVDVCMYICKFVGM
jgi:hypothetical protein